MKLVSLVSPLLLPLLLTPLAAFADEDPYAAVLFQAHCASCHDSGAGTLGRIPQVPVLKTMTAPAILKALESGVMKAQAARLSAEERLKVATLLGTTATMERKREQIVNPCPAGPAWRESSSWASWGGGLANARFQDAKAAGFEAQDLPRLKLKWAFAFPGASTMRSQPAVYRGRVFVGGQDGSIYALDMTSGCVHWSTSVQSQVRSGITVGEIGANPAVFFGDTAGYVYALDGATGKQLWKMRPDDHAAATVTATPVFLQGRLYVGSASSEESLAVSGSYVCCTFRGSELALDAATGKVLWKTYMIVDAATSRQNGRSWGPSGVGVWTSATLDPDRDTMYLTTGENYSDPASWMSDALVALRLSSGEILWSRQFTLRDAWNNSCELPGKVNCPHANGPNFDFAASPVLVPLSNGQRVLLLGQKSGVVYAVDPEQKGQILWRSKIGDGGTAGGIGWGAATDGHNVYVALSDVHFQVTKKDGSNDRTYRLEPKKGGGMFAIRIDSGERIWQTSAPSCGERSPCSPAQSAAISAIPGAVFSGAEDGHLRAYSTANGKIAWDFDTAREFKTVNGAAGRGGTIDVAGPVIAGGMMFAVSGYPERGGMPGNVLLAFALEP